MSEQDSVGEHQSLAAGYHSQVGEEALSYYRAWGVTTQSIDEFQLGWVSKPLLAQHEGMVGMPVFPYFTVGGRVTQLRFNAFEADAAGLHTSIITNHDFPLEIAGWRLYNVRHALPGLRTAQVVICSDVHSVIMARQRGWRAVAVPGYNHWWEPWGYLLEEAHVIFVWNEDEQDHVDPIMTQFKRLGIEVLPVRLGRDQRLGALLEETRVTGELTEVVSSLKLNLNGSLE